MSKYLDLINVMAYDLHGPWDPVVGINAPLYAGALDNAERARQLNFDAIAKYWIGQGKREINIYKNLNDFQNF